MGRASWLLLGGFAVGLTCHAASPPVKVSLRSSWPSPPLLAEILETVSLENPNAFFKYLNRLTDSEVLPNPHTLSAEALHLSALEIALSSGILREPGSMTAVEMNLALHAATPKIEAFYQYYEDQHNGTEGTDCGSWVDWYGKVVCDIETLVHLAGVETIDSTSSPSADPAFPRPKVLSFDHIHPIPSQTMERPPRTAIFYASLASPNFRELHTYLLSLADKPGAHVEYVFRHKPPKQRSESRSYLSGYGVALDLKKMDYLALDDRYSHSRGNGDGGSTNNGDHDSNADSVLSLILAHPENSSAPDANTALTEDELTELGLQAAQIISDSSKPLATLTKLSQNFPKYATSLARRVVVNSSVSEELHANSVMAQSGINMFWLNGAVVEWKDVNPFTLLRLLKKERGAIKSLTGLGLERKESFELLTHPAVAAAQKSKGGMDGLFDASDRIEEGGIIIWWNDMEKDSRYARWNPSLYVLLRPLYPGQFPNVKRNLFNIVLVLDLSQTSSLNFVAGPMANILERNFPLRFGLVPIAENEEGTKMARLFYYLIDTYGRKKTLGFLKLISQVQVHPQMQTPTVQWDRVRAAFDDMVAEDGDADSQVDFDAILRGEATVPAPLLKVAAYTERLGATLAASSRGHAFFNGKHFEMNDDFLKHMQNELGVQMTYLQERIYDGSLSDDNKVDTENFFYDLPTTSKRRNRYTFPSGTRALRIVNLPELFEKTGLRIAPSSFIYPEHSDTISMSLYIIADLDGDDGLDFVKEALSSFDSHSQTRITFIHNPSNTTRESDGNSRLISQLLLTSSLSKASPSLLLRSLGLQGHDDSQIPLSTESDILQLTGGLKPKEYSEGGYVKYLRASQFCMRELKIKPGQLALIINGRVVGPIEPREFRTTDFKSLEEYELRKRIEPVITALKEIKPGVENLDRASFANLMSLSSSIIAGIQLPDPSEIGLFDAPPRPRQRNYQLLSSRYTGFEYGDNSTAIYHVSVLVDPLSTTAQKWSSILEWLSNIPDIFIEVHLNPAAYAEVPLKRFFRYNLLPSLTFDEAGEEIPAQAVFEHLPIDPIFTLAMDVPSSWLARPREALYDLDNIQLGNLAPGDTSLEAVFELDYIVVEGHAREVITNSAPRGVQLELVDSHATPIDDTQVVANLGYLQFKAKPGVFNLEIRKGRGRDIFTMQSVGNEGWDSPSVGESGSEITVTSFEGVTLYPRLLRNPGKETADVLDDDKEEGSGGFFEDVTSKVMSFFTSKGDSASNSVVPVTKQADINIFTVASGLLYERFVGIMILSVLRNTNSTVKFWFIENFLSPSFLEFIPHLAEKYNFQYELVTYKWPSWLRAQTEKQRIIWAYKILFLDVLFPMDLKKVIFVDADQIVRADLKELVDLDLQGAPYGYTPMGDDNHDMEGFRFWKTGYWKEFLQGRPYHISALYVIDLVRFRQMAAGDILRGQYQALSADPNSLANLDQDLPNNIQKEVPIFSLDEDWLWCETWCSKDRLHRAKTIDLCQNPLTKEPKLARARQIPEWEEYDAEIARFSRELASQGKMHSRVATADANALAGAVVTQSDQSDNGATEEDVAETTQQTTDDSADREVVRDEL